MHVGQLWHGVHPLRAGVRQNLVAWLKSSRQRGSAAEAYADMCLGGGAGDAWEVKGVAAGGRAEEGEQELRRARRRP